MNHPKAVIELENGAAITAELYPEHAPNTVRNFISLANSGFYDGTVFHRVIPGFMIQGGDPLGNGIGGPGYSIKGEFSDNGFENPLLHEEGVLSMARSMEMDSAGSQFFVMDASAPHLDGQYAAFGKVTEGIGEVHRIANVPRDFRDKPEQDEKIRQIRVDTMGDSYPEPEKCGSES